MVARASFFSNLFGGQTHATEGPQFVRIDRDADGSIDGSSDELFGPLVRCYVLKLYNNALELSIRLPGQHLEGGHMHVGTQAALLIGFLESEVDAFRAMMQAMDADIVRLICCNSALLRGPLNEALEVEAVPDYEKVCVASQHCFSRWRCVSDKGQVAVQPALGTRRAVILSGMSSAEVGPFAAGAFLAVYALAHSSHAVLCCRCWK